MPGRHAGGRSLRPSEISSATAVTISVMTQSVTDDEDSSDGGECGADTPEGVGPLLLLH
jgi:hypothetical protein